MRKTTETQARPMRRIFFFATPSDIRPVLRRLEANAPLQFVETGAFAKPNRNIYLSSSDIPNAGISTHETGNSSIEYMVSHRDEKNKVQQFVDDTGKQRWLLTNFDNDDVVLLTMAGIWKTNILLPGLMDTLHETPVSQQLMKWFLSALKQENFVKIEHWWLGGEAMDLFKMGWRLTKTAEQSPPEFDLKLP